MAWVERLAAAVAWQSRELEISWSEIEQRLGVELPEDFKSFCECFGVGQFNEYLEVYSSPGGNNLGILDRMARFRRILTQHPVVRGVYEPYGLFWPGRGGLLPWGISETAAEFYWLARYDIQPSDWPVLARQEGGQWKAYGMTMSEFTYKMLLDVTLRGFTIADLVPDPFYDPAP
ncbi:SMI1/KNR4 family protein [Streptomyces maremycinicus]|uniref:SMI1/KNR4 family protein n=1 Tax=Streptomyces maremycinicus TaxID=1679753 RepID=UPI0007C85372|nr:SMI1/KNR4 family protein [Streptomyces sp. NBRC 110468]